MTTGLHVAPTKAVGIIATTTGGQLSYLAQPLTATHHPSYVLLLNQNLRGRRDSALNPTTNSATPRKLPMLFPSRQKPAHRNQCPNPPLPSSIPTLRSLFLLHLTSQLSKPPSERSHCVSILINSKAVQTPRSKMLTIGCVRSTARDLFCSMRPERRRTTQTKWSKKMSSRSGWRSRSQSKVEGRGKEPCG